MTILRFYYWWLKVTMGKTKKTKSPISWGSRTPVWTEEDGRGRMGTPRGGQWCFQCKKSEDWFNFQYLPIPSFNRRWNVQSHMQNRWLRMSADVEAPVVSGSFRSIHSTIDNPPLLNSGFSILESKHGLPERSPARDISYSKLIDTGFSIAVFDYKLPFGRQT